MAKSFYGNLAVNNIRKNGRGYIPYMLTCIFSIMIFYIMVAIVYNPDLTKMLGGDTLKAMLGWGAWVVGFFSAIFLFYTNSFLIKQRKKELALYNILGMAKRHVGKVFFMETLITSLVSLVLGLAAGVVFGKLVFLLLLKILEIRLPMEYVFSPDALVTTVILFGAIFCAVLLCNLGRIRLSNPMELLAGARRGEKEPKIKWLLVAAGLAAVGIGYYMAITVVSPLEALFVFFVAVILVIIGTYLLFIAGSIALLKLLRRNKRFYYKTEHFTAVSGMLYRMKRNAAGLASICILSTMVLVTVSTTVSLQMGVDDVVNRNFPHDIQIKAFDCTDEKEQASLLKQAKDTLEQEKVGVKSVTHYPVFYFSAFDKGNKLISTNLYPMDEEVVEVQVIPVKGSSLEEQYGSLEKDEVLISGDKVFDSGNLWIGDREFRIRDGQSDFEGSPAVFGSMVKAYSILVADRQVEEQIVKETGISGIDYFIGMDIGENSWKHVGKAMEKLQSDFSKDVRAEDRESKRIDAHFLYGGLLFVGIFLGILFLLATVLIIYYKQITEGYEDSESYKIMQKVGMSRAEVKRSIRSQILIVFFLPLVVAVLHTAAAFNMMSKLLIALQISNVWLFVVSTAVTILVFTVIYIAVYSMTAREYYKLVR